MKTLKLELLTPVQLKIHLIRREFQNDWLTIEKFADYHGLSEDFARALIKEGEAIEEFLEDLS